MDIASRRRKAALIEAGVTSRSVAEALGVDESMVSHALAGRRLHMPEALKIQEYVASVTGKSVKKLWPPVQVPARRADDRRSA